MSKEILLVVESVSNEKGVEELITSFRKAGLKKTKLVIIGDGPDHKYLVSK